jgi:hypothetical protein
MDGGGTLFYDVVALFCVPPIAARFALAATMRVRLRLVICFNDTAWASALWTRPAVRVFRHHQSNARNAMTPTP